MADDFLVDRLHQMIHRGLPPPPWRDPLDPPAALEELRAWIDADHQWDADTAVQNWRSLLEDVLASFDALPHAVKTQIDPRVATPLNGVRAALTTLQRRGKAVLNASLRQELDKADAALRQALLDPETLLASWTDVVRAVKRNDLGRETQALALLSALAEMQGKPPEPLRKRLWQVLGDDDIEISKFVAELAGQAEPEPRLPPQRGGLSSSQRLDLATRVLQLPPVSGDLVVWLAYLEAHVPQFVLQLGGAVALYEGRWLASVLEHWDSSSPNVKEVPAEVAAHRDDCLRAWSRSGEKSADRPFALVRVALGCGVVSEAVSDGRATAEVLLQLASLYSGGRVSWRDIGSFIVFVNGVPQWQTLGIDDLHPERGMNLSLARDHTAEILEELETTVGPHLPVKDPQIEVVLDLLRWLVEAQQTWTPAKFLLCDRILEQVSAWAGETDSARFARTYLALPWVWDEITSEIAEAVRQGVYSIDRGGVEPSDPKRRKAFLEAIGTKALVKQGPGMKETYNYQRGLLELDWLLSWQRRGADAELELDRVKKRLGTAKDAARTFDDMRSEFNRLLERARRTRNVVAHGGPIAPATLQSVGRFFESVATDALNEALYARMTGADVEQHFAVRQGHHDKCVEDLRKGTAPAQALFWRL